MGAKKLKIGINVCEIYDHELTSYQPEMMGDGTFTIELNSTCKKCKKFISYVWTKNELIYTILEDNDDLTHLYQSTSRIKI